MSKFGDRIVVLIDMDCFFCQVETKLQPELKGKPLAVVQYGSFGPSAIIAVNYEARDYGVTRHMRGPEAKEKCPDIVLVTVPPIRNKPDTGRYRTAGREVIDVLKKYCSVIERASVDEAYLDITSLVEERMQSLDKSRGNMLKVLENTFVVGYCDDDSNDEEQRTHGTEKWLSEAFEELGDVQARKLAIAGMLVEEFRAAIWSQCEYRCSAGISYNKILAKLACGIHKPNRQTILPTAAVPGLYASLPVKKVRNLGGKFGNIVMESLGCNVMADLLKYSLQDLQKRFDEKTGLWLYNIARGMDNEPVVNRLICKSIGSSKNFPGKAAITKLEDLKRWIGELVEELVERLEQDMEENERRATHLTLSYHWYQDKKAVSQSKSCPLTSYKVERISNLIVNVITKATQKPIAFIGMSAGKFVAAKGSGNFVNFFKSGKPEESQVKSLTEGSKNINSNDEQLAKTKICELEETEEHFLDSGVKFDESKIKTYSRKSVPKVEQKSSSFFTPQDRSIEHKITLPETSRRSDFLLSTGIPKTLDGENFKSSFFMNFLKDSGSSLADFSAAEQSPEAKAMKKPANLEIIEANSLDKGEIESPDLFDDCEETAEHYEEEFSREATPDEDEVKLQVKTDNSALAQLKDIFPDLNNIDTSVLQLLPIELQREAHAYIKTLKSSSTKIDVKNVKSKSKAKSIATKAPLKNGLMKNFFVQNSPNSGNDSPRKQCPECNQMIIVNKFQEHCDFHVAENLQRMINSSNDAGSSTLRNNDSNINSIVKSPVPKRRLSNEMSQPSKKPRNIQSFFT